MIVWLVGLAWAQDCVEVAPTLRRAQESLLLMEDQETLRALDEVRDAFGCRFISTENLTRYWLLRGAQAYLAGEEGAADMFRSAHGVDPEVWIVDLGDDVHEAYRAAVGDAPPEGRLDVSGAPPGYVVHVDGRVRSLPAKVVAGEHLVQVGKDLDHVDMHRMALVVDGQMSVLDGTIEGVEVPSDTSSAVGLRAHVALGLQGTQGEELTRDVAGSPTTEPATKLSVPLELGLSVLPARGVWLRGQLGVAPVMGGGLLYLGGDEVRAASTAIDVGLGGGVTLGSVDLGLLGGFSVPSRGVVRAVAAVPVVGPLAGELRVGTNIHPARGVEPGGSLHVVFRPALLGD